MAHFARRWLREELPRLEAEGIVASDQAQRIREYYAAGGDAEGRRRAVSVFAVLGVLLVGSGIILIIAHNWADLSRGLRVALAIIPLLAVQTLAFWVSRTRFHRPVWRESIGVAWVLSLGAALALISQTYHTLTLGRFCLIWALLTLPVSYLWPSVFPLGIYPILVLGWATDAPKDWELAFWPLLGLGWPQVRRKACLGFRLGGAFVSLAYAAAVLIGGPSTLDVVAQLSPLSQVYYAAVLTTWFLGNEANPGARSSSRNLVFYGLGLGGIGVMSLMLTYTASWDLGESGGMELNSRLGAEVALIAAWVVTAGVRWARAWTSLGSRARVVGSWILALLLAEWLAREWGRTAAVVVANVYVLVSSACVIADGIRRQHLAFANVGLLWFSAWMVLRFFDMEWGYLVRGTAFVLIGLALLGLNVFLRRAWRRPT